MKILTIQEVLYLHHRIVEETGGAHGVRDLGLLETALERSFAGFGDVQFFATVLEMGPGTIIVLASETRLDRALSHPAW